MRRQFNVISLGHGCRQIVPPFEAEDSGPDGFEIVEPSEPEDDGDDVD